MWMVLSGWFFFFFGLSVISEGNYVILVHNPAYINTYLMWPIYSNICWANQCLVGHKYDSEEY